MRHLTDYLIVGYILFWYLLSAARWLWQDTMERRLDKEETMLRQVVASKAIESVGYEDGEVEVKFRNGSVYRYHGIDQSVYDRFMASQSLGKAVSEVLKAKATKVEKV
jgi:KTSC domain